MLKRSTGLLRRLEQGGETLHQSWRSAFLLALPVPAVALIVALLLEQPSGQVTPFDSLVYPIFTATLLLLDLLLLLRRLTFERTFLAVMGAASLFFLGKLVYILYFLPPGADFFRELSETFPWIPAIYVLTSLLPLLRHGRTLALWFMAAMVGLSVIYSVPNLTGGSHYGQMYALIQLTLANVTFYGLTHFFGLYMKRYIRAQAHVETMEHLSYTDFLTGLPNRPALENTLIQIIEEADEETVFALLFIDIDGFKLINDTMGHETGDTLLVQVADRLQGGLEEADILTRSSGDEFVVLLKTLTRSDESVERAEKLKRALDEPFVLDHQIVNVGVSIGVSVYPDDATEPDALLQHADSAMDHVKHFGKNGVKRYHALVDATLEENKRLERDLRQALAKGELSLFYQPLYDLRTGELVKAEALLRWQHPSLGWVAPTDFIPLTESSGYIVTLGNWVLQAAIQQARTWQLSGIGSPRISVNVSTLQFAQPHFGERVMIALNAPRLDPSLLELELTESIVMRNPDIVRRNLRELQEMGVTVAIDDFGTGYSSLSYLRDYPVNAIKIDRSFIRDLSTPRRARRYAQALIETIVQLAENMGVELIAEGIETRAQFELLRDLGCHIGQGYYFAEPMNEADFTGLLKKNKTMGWPSAHTGPVLN